jgi:hypothetical protein
LAKIKRSEQFYVLYNTKNTSISRQNSVDNYTPASLTKQKKTYHEQLTCTELTVQRGGTRMTLLLPRGFRLIFPCLSLGKIGGKSGKVGEKF